MRKLKGINIAVARSCFVRCPGCYRYFGSAENLISTETILQFLIFLKHYHCIEKVTLYGGDPLARSDILLLLREIKKIGFWINLDTVGTPLLADTETTFVGRSKIARVSSEALTAVVDLLGIPLDGDSNESFLKFRENRSKIFEEQILILNQLEICKTNVCINTVVHKGNINIIKNILPIIVKYTCVKKWQIFQYMPIGPLGFKNRNLYMITEEDFKVLEKEISALYSNMLVQNISIDFKSCADRKNTYLLIDSDGIAWIPKESLSDSWEDNTDSNPDRIILGNINCPTDFSHIIEKVNNILSKLT
jgi:MoaA/NifB/PqqE/SkfB family radical SAM enzyme